MATTNGVTTPPASAGHALPSAAADSAERKRKCEETSHDQHFSESMQGQRDILDILRQ